MPYRTIVKVSNCHDGIHTDDDSYDPSVRNSDAEHNAHVVNDSEFRSYVDANVDFVTNNYASVNDNHNDDDSVNDGCDSFDKHNVVAIIICC